MAKLVLSFQDRIIDEFPLDKERLSIGRAPDNDVRIDNLAVSGHHAEVISIHNECFLEDLNSTNGTFVNGKAVQKQALRGGDYITIGKHSLRFYSEVRASDAEVEKTIAIRRSAPATAPVAAKPMVAGLKVLNGGNAGREMILNKALTKLGKAGYQVAAINKRQDDFFLVHVEGQDGRTPILNDMAIGTQARKLNDGDTIEIAGTKLSFFIRPE